MNSHNVFERERENTHIPHNLNNKLNFIHHNRKYIAFYSFNFHFFFHFRFPFRFLFRSWVRAADKIYVNIMLNEYNIHTCVCGLKVQKITNENMFEKRKRKRKRKKKIIFEMMANIMHTWRCWLKDGTHISKWINDNRAAAVYVYDSNRVCDENVEWKNVIPHTLTATPLLRV